MRAVLIGSRPENGSSRIRISGSCTIVAMNWTFCCIPLESSSTFLLSHGRSSILSSQSPIRSRAFSRETSLIAARKRRWSRTFIFR